MWFLEVQCWVTKRMYRHQPQGADNRNVGMYILFTVSLSTITKFINYYKVYQLRKFINLESLSTITKFINYYNAISLYMHWK